MILIIYKVFIKSSILWQLLRDSKHLNVLTIHNALSIIIMSILRYIYCFRLWWWPIQSNFGKMAFLRLYFMWTNFLQCAEWGLNRVYAVMGRSRSENFFRIIPNYWLSLLDINKFSLLHLLYAPMNMDFSINKSLLNRPVWKKIL